MWSSAGGSAISAATQLPSVSTQTHTHKKKTHRERPRYQGSDCNALYIVAALGDSSMCRHIALFSGRKSELFDPVLNLWDGEKEQRTLFSEAGCWCVNFEGFSPSSPALWSGICFSQLSAIWSIWTYCLNHEVDFEVWGVIWNHCVLHITWPKPGSSLLFKRYGVMYTKCTMFQGHWHFSYLYTEWWKVHLLTYTLPKCSFE